VLLLAGFQKYLCIPSADVKQISIFADLPSDANIIVEEINKKMKCAKQLQQTEKA